ncbi:MAG: L-seryl-tRNA(Sec) selenium transferase [Coriobacteriia bacterium]|nr:L-seryl-tRNA(Sec) selenium transferase [Coriobacteriia bacterium]
MENQMTQYLRNLPRIDDVRDNTLLDPYRARYSADLIARAAREVVEEERSCILSLEGDSYTPKNEEYFARKTIEKLEALIKPSLMSCINAAGVVIHTNMGRAVLSERASQAVYEIARSYSNLELDLQSGKRGLRHSHVEGILTELTGAEAAVVVNNNAAAVMLVLSELAQNKEAIISRGELIEIGGSFRIPEIMRLSNATMVEVGTTNKTHLFDYERAITENTSLFLKVHPSNFRILGFTETPDARELMHLAHEHNIVVYEDLGSGVLVNLEAYGLPHERTVNEALSEGVDVVSFSGDKLLGATQAGIIVGKKAIIDRIKKNQLLRALRPDKLTLAALETTLLEYRNEARAISEIPTLRLLTKSYEELKQQAQVFVDELKASLSEKSLDIYEIGSEPDSSRAGGGSMPAIDIPTELVIISSKLNNEVDLKNSLLHDFDIPIITRIHKDKLALDLRTLLHEEERTYLLNSLKEVLKA